MAEDIKIKGFEVTFKHVEGPEVDEESLIDYFCGTVGRENGAQKPLRFKIYNPDQWGKDSIYEISEVDINA